MIDLAASVRELHYHIRFGGGGGGGGGGGKSDLQWWVVFITRWNGICGDQSVCSLPCGRELNHDFTA